MKKLALRMLLLGLPFAILLGGFEFKYASAHNNPYVVKRELLAAVADQIEILSVGSSHGYYDILPAYLGRKAFNLAAASQSIYYDVQLLHRYADRLRSLKTVVMPVSYFSLETQLDEAPERWRCYYYYRFFGIPQRDRHMAGDVRNFSLYFLYGRDYPFLSPEILRQDVSANFDRSGGITLRGRPKHGLPPTVDAIVRHHNDMKPAHLPENVRLIEQAAAELRRHQIRLVLITPPVTAGYRNSMSPTNYARMQTALRGLQQRLGVTYRNYLDDARFQPDDFADEDHLNQRGAIKFSSMLRELL